MLELEPPAAEIEPTKVLVKLVTEVPPYLPLAGILVGYMWVLWLLWRHIFQNFTAEAERYVVCTYNVEANIHTL